MDIVLIKGPNRLEGTVEVSGAKNAALPIMAATLLASGPCVLKNIPEVSDVISMTKILRSLGAKISYANRTVQVDTTGVKKNVADYSHVKTMRASVCLLGPLLARFRKAQVSMPGGCIIGPRPIDLHLKGLSHLGAKVTLEHGYVVIEAGKLKGSRMYLGGAFGSSVLATANVMMAATLARGKTEIVNAACEPEVVDLGRFLVKMGADIEGLGSPVITITGVKRLQGCEYRIISDRIEAGSYALAAAVTRGDVTLTKTHQVSLGALWDKLQEAGVSIVEKDGNIRIRAKGRMKSVSVTTHVYPGFPTDLQAQMMAFMTLVPGISIITEKIFPERFMHVSELGRMGAAIRLEGPNAIVSGNRRLSGAPVMASDLRASAGLVLAGLAAEGTTEVSRVYHLDRGYERLVEKLQNLGADIRRERR